MAEKGRPLPKFGEWDVNDPASAEGFTVIFNKARNERKTAAKAHSSPKSNNNSSSSSNHNHNHNKAKYKHHVILGKPHSRKWFCCLGASAD